MAGRDRDHAAPDPGQQHDGARVRQGPGRPVSVRQPRVRAARRAAAARDHRPHHRRHRPTRGGGAVTRERSARDRDRPRAGGRGDERHPRRAAHHAREQVSAARPRRPALRRLRYLDRYHRAQALCGSPAPGRGRVVDRGRRSGLRGARARARRSARRRRGDDRGVRRRRPLAHANARDLSRRAGPEVFRVRPVEDALRGRRRPRVPVRRAGCAARVRAGDDVRGARLRQLRRVRPQRRRGRTSSA